MTEQQLLIPMAVGERLRKARQQHRWSVEKTAASLKVPADVLIAIEGDQLDRYAAVYRKGYVQSYARHLGFGETEISAMLAELIVDEPELRPVFNGVARARAGDRWLRATSYVLASLLIGTLAWQLTHEAVRLSQGQAQQDAAVGTGDALTSTEELPGNPTTAHVNASIASLEGLGKMRSGSAASPGQAAWEALKKPEAAAEPIVLPAGQHRLQVTTSGDSWVEIADASGRQLEMDLVRGGSQRAYQGEAPFRILFGRASAVDLFLDGRQVDLSGHTSGDVMRMSLNASEGEVELPSSGPADG